MTQAIRFVYHRAVMRVARVLTLPLLLALAGALVAVWLAGGGAEAGNNTITVTKTEDTDGTCEPDDCSLREAIKAGNSGDHIDVPGGIYTLSLGTQLEIGTSLTLSGAGPEDTIIQAAASSADATSRVMIIKEGNVVISGVTARHGNAGGVSGGGMWNKGGRARVDQA